MPKTCCNPAAYVLGPRPIRSIPMPNKTLYEFVNGEIVRNPVALPAPVEFRNGYIAWISHDVEHFWEIGLKGFVTLEDARTSQAYPSLGNFAVGQELVYASEVNCLVWMSQVRDQETCPSIA